MARQLKAIGASIIVKSVAERSGPLRILVAIASHGEKNRRYLNRLLEVYERYESDVDVVVLSDKPKSLPDGVEIRVGAPTSDPWSLPFAHRALFAERAEDYDLFIYSEDDTEISEDHVAAFLECVNDLPDTHIAGFLRHEIGPDGQKYCSTIHGPYYWDPASLLEANGHVYARYTNDHSAAYILTRAQLAQCIASGGFLRPPHKGRYDMLCSAATDPYVHCGLTKVVRITELERFSLRHLPDIYLGRIGVTWEALGLQIERLIALAREGGRRNRLLATEIDVPAISFDKNHDQPVSGAIIARIMRRPGSVLSIGCESGRTEGALIEAGIDVAAVPIDLVVAASAEARGVEILPPSPDEAIQALGDRRFRHILFNDVLSYAQDPVDLLRRFSLAADADGAIHVAAANASSISARRVYARVFGPAKAVFPPFGRLAAAGYAPADAATVAAWMRAAGLVPSSAEYTVSERWRPLSRTLLGMGDRWLGERLILSGRSKDDA